MTGPSRFGPSLAFWSIGAMAVALLLGLAGHATGAGWIPATADAVAPLGRVWMNALQMTVIPLVITQLLAALVGSGRPSEVGGLGLRALGLFLVLLACAGVVTAAVSPPLLQLYTPSPEVGDALRNAVVPDAARQAAGAPPAGLGDWLVGLVPTNVFEAAARGEILQLLVVTILLGAAVGQLPESRRRPLAEVFKGLADAMMVIVGWVLLGTPVGVFALVLGLSLETGLDVVGVLGAYILMLCGLLLAATALLYPITVSLGRTSLKTFARAAAPAQLVAMSTQSSLASLPALVEGGEEHMKLPRESTGFVLPLCVSTFKLNQAVYPTFELFFLAWVFGIQLGLAEVGTFLVYTTLTSFSVPGVPRGGGGVTAMPAYLAFGIPIEGIVLLDAVKTVPDVFMTLLNVTGDMSVATLLSRRVRGAAGAARADDGGVAPATSPSAAVPGS